MQIILARNADLIKMIGPTLKKNKQLIHILYNSPIYSVPLSGF